MQIEMQLIRIEQTSQRPINRNQENRQNNIQEKIVENQDFESSNNIGLFQAFDKISCHLQETNKTKRKTK